MYYRLAWSALELDNPLDPRVGTLVIGRHHWLQGSQWPQTEDRTHLGEGHEALVPVVVPHTAGPYSAKGHVALRRMQTGVIDGGPARHNVIDVVVLKGSVFGKGIERQRPVASVDVFHHFARGAVRLHRKQGAEYLTLQDGHVLGYAEQQGQRELAQSTIRCLPRKQIDGPGALGDCIVERRLQALIGAFIDDRGVIRMIDVRVTLGN